MSKTRMGPPGATEAPSYWEPTWDYGNMPHKCPIASRGMQESWGIDLPTLTILG